MRRLNLVAWIATVMIAQSAVPATAAESLPMPVARYADLCRQSGGSVAEQLTSGVGLVQCNWPGQGRTDCDVGDDQVNVCGISCQSNACLKANPARHSPVWPLQGGPSGG
jgi:hypothetical protein